MTSALSKRLERLEALMAARSSEAAPLRGAVVRRNS